MKPGKVKIENAQKLLKLLFIALLINIGNYVGAQTSVNDRNINTLNIFKDDTTKMVILPYRLQPASGGVVVSSKDSLERAKASISKAINLLAEGNMAMALFNIHDALSYTPSTDIRTYAIATSYYGVIQIKLKNHAKAVNALNECDSLFRQIDDINLLAFHYNNLGLFNQQFYGSATADRYFMKALSISRRLDDKANIAITLNQLSKGREPVYKKILYLREAIDINKRLGKEVPLAENYNNLATIYAGAKLYDSARAYISLAGNIASHYNAVEIAVENYKLKARVSFETGYYKDAYESLQKSNELMRSLSTNSIIGDVEQLIESRILAKKNYELNLKNKELEIKKLNNFFTITLSLLIITLLLSLYIYILINSRRKLDCLESNRQIIQNEKEYIENELINIATFLSSRNEVLNNIQSGLSKAYQLPEKEIAAEVRKLNMYVKSLQTKNPDVEDILVKTDKINQDFIDKLTSLHDNLTKNDKNIALLLRAGLSTKQIATLMDCSPKSVNMARYRMRLHLKLNSDANLTNYLKSL